MRSLSPDVVAALASGHVVIVTLLKIEFPGTTILLNSSDGDVDFAGDTYQGAKGLGRIAPMTEQPGELPGLQLELLAGDDSTIALALDQSAIVQGSLVTIRTAVLDASTLQVLDAPLDWIGYADTMPIVEDGGKAFVALTAECKGVDLLRGSPLTYSDADQRSLYPSDRAFEYVVSQVDQPVIWPKKEWFYK